MVLNGTRQQRQEERPEVNGDDDDNDENDDNDDNDDVDDVDDNDDDDVATTKPNQTLKRKLFSPKKQEMNQKILIL